MQRVFPGASGNDAALVRGVEHNLCADFIGDGAHLAHRMFEKVQAATHGDQLGPHFSREVTQRFNIQRVAVGIHWGRNYVQPVQASAAACVMGDVATDGGRGRNDRVAGFTGCHERIEIGDSAGRHPNFGVFGLENFGA